MVKFGALAGAHHKIALKQYLVNFYLGFAAFGAPLDAYECWY